MKRERVPSSGEWAGGEAEGEGKLTPSSVQSPEPIAGLSLRTTRSYLSRKQESHASTTQPPRCPWHFLFSTLSFYIGYLKSYTFNKQIKDLLCSGSLLPCVCCRLQSQPPRHLVICGGTVCFSEPQTSEGTYNSVAWLFRAEMNLFANSL